MYYPTSNKNKGSRTSNLLFQVRACTFEQRTVAIPAVCISFLLFPVDAFMSINHRACILHSSPTKETCPVGSWPPSGKVAQAVTTTTPERNQSKSSPVGSWPPAGSPGGQGGITTSASNHTHLHLVTWKGDATHIGHDTSQCLPSSPDAAAHIIMRPAASDAVEAVPRIARSTTPLHRHAPPRNLLVAREIPRPTSTWHWHRTRWVSRRGTGIRNLPCVCLV